MFQPYSIGPRADATPRVPFIDLGFYVPREPGPAQACRGLPRPAGAGQPGRLGLAQLNVVVWVQLGIKLTADWIWTTGSNRLQAAGPSRLGLFD